MKWAEMTAAPMEEKMAASTVAVMGVMMVEMRDSASAEKMVDSWDEWMAVTRVVLLAVPTVS